MIEVEFSVTGAGSHLHGDGFAFWLTSDRAKPGPVFGSVDYFTGLGVFFDTYPNTRHSYQFPRITAMLGDGKTKYDLEKDNQDTEAAACSVDFRQKDVETKFRLIYLKNRILQVRALFFAQFVECFPLLWLTLTAPESLIIPSPYFLPTSECHLFQLVTHVEKTDEWKSCWEIPDYTLPAGDLYIGFSALTGDVSDNHE